MLPTKTDKSSSLYLASPIAKQSDYQQDGYSPPKIQTFKQREYLPTGQDLLWAIDAGMVCISTFHADGSVVPIGLWGTGDIVGHPLTRLEPYQIECLYDVKVHQLLEIDSPAFDQAMRSHLHQSEILVMVRHGPLRMRIKTLLTWFAHRFGHVSGDGSIVSMRLTHQVIADLIGATRVTVTRMMQGFEQEGFVQRVQERFVFGFARVQPWVEAHEQQRPKESRLLAQRPPSHLIAGGTVNAL
ncbi:MAG: Crp/Fnr family transcriptional regulator [Thermosynechococcaceae cyanobacterium]